MAQFKMSCGTYDPLSLNSRLNTVGDQFGDSMKRNGDHFRVDLGIISGAVQYSILIKGSQKELK